jgi:Fe-S-cluster-containing hydrogenase component 2
MLKVRKEFCAGCGICARVCPTGAILLVAGTAKIYHAKCTSCYLCIQACPRGAIVAVETVLKPAAVSSIQELKNSLLRLQAELETTAQRLQRLKERKASRHK